MNDKKECQGCKIVSRKGGIILYNLHNNTQDHCPHCEQRQLFSTASYKPAPLAPKFSWRKCREIGRMEDKKILDDAIDRQMKSYLALQQKKLKNMKKDDIND